MLKYFRRTALARTVFFTVADAFFVVISIWLAFLLRFDGNIPSHYFPFLYQMMILAVVFVSATFYFWKLYSFSWSYVSTTEAVSLFRAVTIAFILLSAAIFISHYFPYFINFPRSTIIVSYILVFFFCGSIRFAKRIYLMLTGHSVKSSKDSRTLIVGAGDAGEQILRSIISSKNSPYSPIGFIDDSPFKQGVSIHGVKVCGKILDLPRLIGQLGIEKVVIALPTASNNIITTVIELARSSGVKSIKIAPLITDVIDGRVSAKNLKDVDITDLLGRDEVDIDLDKIEKFIKGKKVLVTGAAGSIGSELCRQTAKFNPSLLILLDQEETGIFNISEEISEDFRGLNIKSVIADITDKGKIDKAFGEFKPDIVFHAAAYKHVPLMEKDPIEAVKNNIFGTEVVAKASLDNSAEKFIFISTDKAVNPSSVMGATKRVCEKICQLLNQENKTKFVSVRFGNVLNSRGSVIPIFTEQIKKGGPVTVTHKDMTRYFMLISEACLLVMQSACMGDGGEVFVLDMGKPVKILDLAKEMIKLSGFISDKDIAIVFTGIRPGEKLFEETLTAEEGDAVTENQKIFIAKLSNIDRDKIKKSLEDFKKFVSENNQESVISVLKSVVTSYKQS